VKLCARLSRLEQVAAAIRGPIDDESAMTRRQMECLVLASRLPEHRRGYDRLGELAARGAENLTIPECREYTRLITGMLVAGAGLCPG
jgi:hypothetical protein